MDAWRGARYVPMACVRSVGGAYIAHYRALAERNLRPFLPRELGDVPMDNIEFLPIKDAWFSGSMNYLGRKRRPGGRPEYEASYEINASLQITVPEFEQLVSHEVVPGHVTTFAFLQDLFWRKQVGFEASVLTMNTRGATLSEGIANNAILIALRRDRAGADPRRRPQDRPAARTAAGRRQEPGVVPDLEGGAWRRRTWRRCCGGTS